MSRTKQRTVTVGDEKVTIKSYARSYCGNKVGFYVRINGTRYYHNSLNRQEAEEGCVAKWAREFDRAYTPVVKI